MHYSFIVVVTAAFIGFSCAKIVQVKNGGSDVLSVQISGQDVVGLNPGESIEVKVDDKWKGQVHAWLDACKSHCTDVATVAEFAMGSGVNGMDHYDVSVVNGFNRRMKIAPTGDLQHQCKAALCEARINHVCPKDKQVQDNLGRVVACKNDATVFQKLCPLAIVSEKEDNKSRVFSCDADKYLVIVG